MSIGFADWLRNPNAGVRLGTALVCLFSASCGDDSYRLGGAREASGAGVDRVGKCADGADVELLDSMEDGDGTIEMIGNRGGVWFSFNDKSDGSQIPPSDAEVFSMSALVPPRANSHYAARTHGRGFTRWGAGIGFELYNQKAYDVSSYAGVTFWARRAAGKTSALRFAMTDSATAPRGGQCHEYVDYSECSDYFGADLMLDTTFRRYSFSWKELTQAGWGSPLPDSINTREVYGVRFQVGKQEDFDFWIDDVALLCRSD